MKTSDQGQLSVLGRDGCCSKNRRARFGSYYARKLRFNRIHWKIKIHPRKNGNFVRDEVL